MARSPAIDYCDDVNAPQFDDLNGNTRGVAWSGPTTGSGTRPASGNFDLGAFEIPFEIQNTDVAVESTAPARFVGGGSFTLELELTNQGANTAFGDISVIDDFTTGAVVNQQWTCTPPAGVTCSPSSGSGDMTTAISDLEPGQSVMFEVTAEPSNPATDQEFEYIMIATESSFNLDTNVSNNEVSGRDSHRVVRRRVRRHTLSRSPSGCFDPAGPNHPTLRQIASSLSSALHEAVSGARCCLMASRSAGRAVSSIGICWVRNLTDHRTGFRCTASGPFRKADRSAARQQTTARPACGSQTFRPMAD